MTDRASLERVTNNLRPVAERYGLAECFIRELEEAQEAADIHRYICVSIPCFLSACAEARRKMALGTHEDAA